MFKLFLLDSLGLFFALIAASQSAAAPPAWSEANSPAALTSENRRGTNPAYLNAPLNPNVGIPGGKLEDDGGSLSGNYTIVIPLLDVPGRGLPMQLNMYFSSQLWAEFKDPGNPAATALAFDMDSDWPSPGWSLGFGKISASNLLIGADNSRQQVIKTGTRTTARGVASVNVVIGNSLIKIEKCCYSDRLRQAVLRTGDGGYIEYFSPEPNYDKSVYYPTRIVDKNGNYISITYRRTVDGHPAPPALDSIVDTAKRRIQFHYDLDGLLTAISGPAFGGGRRAYARFVYSKRTINVNIGSSCTPFSRTLDFLNGVVLTGNATAYWLNLMPNGTGMADAVEQTRDVKTAGEALIVQPSILSKGAFTKKTSFNYDSQPISCLRTPPKYTEKRVEWTDSDLSTIRIATTSYSRVETADDVVMTVTHPDQARSRQLFPKASDPLKYLVAGQVRRTETIDASGTLVSSTNFEWENFQNGVTNAFGAARQRAVIQVIDPLARWRRTQFSYDLNYPSLVVKETRFGFDDERLLAGAEFSKEIIFVRRPDYIEANLLSLPESVRTYFGVSRNPTSRTDYSYDEFPLTPVGDVWNHLAVYEPRKVRRCAKYEIDPQTGKPHCISYKLVDAKIVTARGNATTVTTFVRPASGEGKLSDQTKYDSAGNAILVSRDQKSGALFTYNSSTFFSAPVSMVLGSLDVQSPSRIKYEFGYDTSTGAVTSMTDPDSRSISYLYESGPSGLRRQLTTYPDGTSKKIVYDDSKLKLEQVLLSRSGAGHLRSVSSFDGNGSLRRIEYDRGKLITKEIEYDNFGRVSRRSLDYDPGQTPVWNTYSYDALGRVVAFNANTERSVQIFRDEPRAPPAGVEVYPLLGSTARVVNNFGIEKWYQFDRNDYLAYVVEPNPESPSGGVFGSSVLSTRLVYAPEGRLRLVFGGDQSRGFDYDGVGRLKGMWLPERRASIDTSGKYVGNSPTAMYSDFFEYDAHSNLISMMDSRGIRKIFDYDGDPLNRLKQIRYESSGPIDPANPIDDAPTETYVYATAGNIRRLVRTDVQGILSEETKFDQNYRPATKIISFNGIAAPLVFDIAYDGIGRNTKIVYPDRKVIGGGVLRHSLDFPYQDNRVADVRLDGNPLVSNLDYFGDGRIKHLELTTPNGIISEDFQLDPSLGLLSRQSAAFRGGASLLDLEYKYRKQSAGLFGRDEVPGVVGYITAALDLLDSTKTQDFGYDALGRLVSASAGDAMQSRFDPEKVSWQRYTYDRYGNRTSVRAYKQVEGRPSCFPVACTQIDLPEDSHDGIRSLTVDVQTNRITNAGYAYDAAGNLISGFQMIDGVSKRRAYRYDSAGRLTRIIDPSDASVIEQYSYGVGRQLAAISRASGESEKFGWLGGRRLVSYSVSQNGTLDWVEGSFYLGDRRLASVVSNQLASETRVHLADHRGTAVTIVGNGGLVERRVTRPFGTEAKSSIQSSDSKRFTSYDRSPVTGIDYAVNRFYRADMGRFMSPDPLAQDALIPSLPQSLNAYSYARNSPISMVDPEGLLPGWTICVYSGPADDPYRNFHGCRSDVGGVPAPQPYAPTPGSGGGGGGGGSAPKSESKQPCDPIATKPVPRSVLKGALSRLTPTWSWVPSANDVIFSGLVGSIGSVLSYNTAISALPQTMMVVELDVAGAVTGFAPLEIVYGAGAAGGGVVAAGVASATLTGIGVGYWIDTIFTTEDNYKIGDSLYDALHFDEDHTPASSGIQITGPVVSIQPAPGRCK